MHHVRIVEGLTEPSAYFVKLKEAEAIKGFYARFAALIVLSVLLAAASAYLGIHTEAITAYLDLIKREKFEFAKLLFGIGGIVASIAAPLIMVLFFTFVFKVFYRDIEWDKLITLQLFPLFLMTMEKLLNFPFFHLLGVQRDSSPFGFGVLIQLLTDQTFAVTLVSCITVFLIWSAYVQTIGLKMLSGRSWKRAAGTVIFSNLLYILLAAVFTVLVQDIGISLQGDV
ncbi:YIP1 family protein [Metabacillus indicus]|uniref:YIP1 family protein n=1 Tax=Metabacillus indicus TaxID=246786 RepID=UPI00398444EB